ncbi:MAG: hypothetical protein Q9182_004102 [Xanthomendoza sp. 2 TL-2023]
MLTANCDMASNYHTDKITFTPGCAAEADKLVEALQLQNIDISYHRKVSQKALKAFKLALAAQRVAVLTNQDLVTAHQRQEQKSRKKGQISGGVGGNVMSHRILEQRQQYQVTKDQAKLDTAAEKAFNAALKSLASIHLDTFYYELANAYLRLVLHQLLLSASKCLLECLLEYMLKAFLLYRNH